MRNCENCNQQMDEEFIFCLTCDESQLYNSRNQQKSKATILSTLCVLTITGSVLTIGLVYLFELISSEISNVDYYRSWIYAGTSIGTLIGASLMLQRELIGLYIYTVFQAIYIITVVIALFSNLNVFGNQNYGHSILTIVIALFFLIPSAIVLRLYWNNDVDRHLV